VIIGAIGPDQPDPGSVAAVRIPLVRDLSAIGRDLRVDVAGALRRVVVNLLDNAIKYTPAGGRIRIEAESVENSVAIRFIDTGCGIPPEDLPRIWDRLFRGDKSRSERGLGLGLSFVRAIVESHGGKVMVKSHPEGGTTAGMLLPSADVDAPRHLASS
jgi:signal transduction histidine kinase